MGRPLRWYDYFTVNIYFTGLMTMAQAMTPLIVPLLVQGFVGAEQQGTYYGTIRLWSLMAAVLVQSLVGMLSDHSTLRWGRRRPFILLGTLANILVIAGIGFTARLQGMSGYWTLFILLIMMQVAANTGQGAAQGLIPDIVPENLRGRFSGVKAVLEVPVPVILVSFLVSRYITAGSIWAALLAVILILVFTTLVALAAPEKRPQKLTSSLNWKPFLRLLLMTAVFISIILSAGQVIRLAGGLIHSGTSLSILFVAAAGLLVMTATIILGVWLSVGVGIGTTARQQGSYIWWIINRLAFLLGATNLASFAIYYLQGRLGLERELAAGPASRLIFIVGVSILLMGIPSGWLSDRFGSKRLVSFSGAVAAAGTAVIVATPNLAMMFLGAVLIGASAGLFYTASWALGTELVPKSEAGRYLGISNLAGAGAGAVGAYIGGPIADAITRSQPASPGAGYVVLFTIYGIVFLFSMYAAGRIDLPDLVYKPVAVHTTP
jgi:MFS family permease